MWLPFMAHIFLLFSAVIEHILELSQEVRKLWLYPPISMHHWLSVAPRGGVSTLSVFLQASAAKENSQTVVGNLL